MSCRYNLNIKERQRSPIATREGKEYFSIPRKDGSGEYIVERDGLGNITFVSQEEADRILKDLREAADKKARQKNIEEALEEVNLYDETPAPAEPTSPEEMSIDDINRQLLGEFTTPAETPTQAAKPAKPVEEIKEEPVQEAKEVITDVGNKSLEELQNKENLSTFAEIIVSNEYGDALYDVLEKKGWGVNEDMPIRDMENLLKQHNVPITNITNIQSWMDLIKDCR